MNNFCRNITDYLIDKQLEGGGGGSSTVGAKDTDLGFTDKEDITNSLKNFVEKGSKETLVLSSGKNYKITGTISINRPITIEGNNSKITTDEDNATLLITSDNVNINKCVFDKIKVQYPVSAYNFKIGSIISNCVFQNYPNASAIKSDISKNQTARNITIKNNIFKNNLYSIFGGFVDSLIQNNQFFGMANGRNIELTGGINNIIENNKIIGGITGITFLSNKAVSTQLPYKNNIIRNNIIKEISEESISMDVFGDSASNVGVLLDTKIVSINSKWVILEDNFDKYTPTGMYLVVNSGTNVGNISYIQYTGSYIDRVEVEDVNGFTIGDSVSIIIPAMDNLIQDNEIQGGSICLWGNAINNTIEGNRIFGSSIRVDSLFGLGGGFTAKCSNNIVKYNTIIDGKILMDTRTYGSAIATECKGNVAKANMLFNSTLELINQDSNTDAGNYKVAMQS